MNRLYLYGIAGADDNYRVVTHVYIDSDTQSITVRNIVNHAAWIKYKYPGVEHVYVIDGSRNLGVNYMDTVRRNTMEKNVEFKHILEMEGLLVI